MNEMKVQRLAESEKQGDEGMEIVIEATIPQSTTADKNKDVKDLVKLADEIKKEHSGNCTLFLRIKY